MSNPAVAEFVLNMTEHENANVRKQAALAIGSEWAMGIDGMVDAILKLMGDEDEEVRTCAYKYAGRLHDEPVIDAAGGSSEGQQSGSVPRCVHHFPDLYVV